MVGTLREIKNRIRGIGNVNKITHAMEMISIAKLKPAKSRLLAFRPYFSRMEKMFHDLLVAEGIEFSHPLLEKRVGLKKKAFLVITSDTGLCSGYNHAVIRAAEDFINSNGRDTVVLMTAGRKAFNYFRRKGIVAAKTFNELKGHYSDEAASRILNALTDSFLLKETDEVFLCYTYFDSTSRHRPVIEKFLNIDGQAHGPIQYLFEPGGAEMLEELLPLYLFSKIKVMLLNSFTTEHSTRIIAMREASENANQLLEGLVLLRNKVRQANITREIMEIVSSAEVLR